MISDEANYMLSNEIARMIKADPPDRPRRYADGRIEPARISYTDTVAARLAQDAQNASYEANQLLTEEVVRLAATLDPGHTYDCPVPDCTWELDVPVPTSTVDEETHAWTMNGYSRDDVERVLAAHLDSHARDDGERRP